MTDARYDKHVNAAPLDIIAPDLGSRRPEKAGAVREEKRFQKCPAAYLAGILYLVSINELKYIFNVSLRS